MRSLRLSGNYRLFTLLGLLLTKVATGQHEAQQSPNNQTVADIISIYQKHISSIRPDECPMYPSCSRYGMAQFRTQPALNAFFNTSDRLMRCGHDHRNYPLYATGNTARLIDTGSQQEDAQHTFRFTKRYFAYADTIESSASLRFIQYLMNEHYYDQALLEITRVLYNKQEKDSKALYINYIRCLKAKGEYEKITYEYEVNFPQYLHDDADIRIEISQVWMQLRNYANVRSALELPLTTTPPTSFGNRAALLNGLAYTRQYNWVSSRQTFTTIEPGSSAYTMAQSAIKIIDKSAHLTEKKPALAGLLSIVPGAGYFYAGHRQTALTALLLNSLLGFATLTTIRSRNYGMAGLTGAFAASFYAGNITGSVKSARRHNQQQKEAIAGSIDQLIQLQ